MFEIMLINFTAVTILETEIFRGPKHTGQTLDVCSGIWQKVEFSQRQVEKIITALNYLQMNVCYYPKHIV